jgi:hypothetical protein
MELIVCFMMHVLRDRADEKRLMKELMANRLRGIARRKGGGQGPVRGNT